VGGVPLKESGEGEQATVLEQMDSDGGVDQEFGAPLVLGEVVGVEHELDEEDAAVQEFGALVIIESQSDSAPGPENTQVSMVRATTEDEHESTARKRRARRKRALDSARKLRRSTRLAEKERPTYEDPNSKATRVQQARVDFFGASRWLHAALSKTHLISDPYLPNADLQALADVAVACGASKEDTAALREVSGEPSGAE
jgi:uncharacterized protein YbaA (DUF1428 family)